MPSVINQLGEIQVGSRNGYSDLLVWVIMCACKVFFGTLNGKYQRRFVVGIPITNNAGICSYEKIYLNYKNCFTLVQRVKTPSEL
jgi:hypothetical protein